MGFTSLAYFIDIDWLREAYRRTRKDGAVGVDGQSGADYAVDLESNLRSLLERAKSGTYQAPPVRRVRIPKAGSATETRPLGIPTFEDKVLQRAVVMVLAGLRAGLQGLLVRLPSGTIGAPSPGEPLATDDGDGRRLDRGG
jgi:retron-type reverse transcriptase